MKHTLLFCLFLTFAPAAAASSPPPPLPPAPQGPPAPGALLRPSPPGAAHRPPGRPPIPPSLLEEARAQEPVILAWAEANDPESHERLQLLKTSDTRAYMGQLVRVARMMERSERDPDVAARHARMQEIEEQLRIGTTGWAQLDAQGQEERRAELVTLTTELLAIRQEERRAHLEELQLRIAELREEIERRDADRARIVEEYVDELVSGEAP